MHTEDCPAVNNPNIEQLFVAWDTPENRVPDFECHNDIVDFPEIVGYLKALVEKLLSKPEWLHEDVQALIANKTPTVTMMGTADYTKTSYLPAIGIEFGGAELKQQFGLDSQIEYNLAHGTSCNLLEWTSTYTINVMAKSCYETFLLGTSLARCFAQAKSIIKSVLNQRTVQVTSLGKPTPRSEANPELGFILPITLMMTSMETWDVTAIAPILKKAVAVANIN